MRRVLPSPTAVTALSIAFSASCLVVSSAFAVDFVVTKTTDSNDSSCDADCSLREAIVAANGKPGQDRVVLQEGIYVLTIAGTDDSAAAGDLDITDDTILEGAGPLLTTIDAGGVDRVLHISSSGDLTLRGVTITGGADADTTDIFGANGNGAYNLGVLEITNSVFSGNEDTAVLGDGVHNEGTLHLDHCFFDGDGIDATGVVSGAVHELRMTECWVRNSPSDGIKVDGTFSLGTTNVFVSSSTISGSAGDGLGVFASFEVANSTISGSGDSALDVSNIGTGLLDGVSLLGDLDSSSPPALSTRNSIFTGSCSHTITSLGGNLESETDTCGLTETTDQHSVALAALALLDLAFRGGPTPTVGLGPDSVAIDSGVEPCLSEDQRGVERPRGITCDSGAFESGAIFASGFEAGNLSDWETSS